jgi:hypothetical protein
MTILAALSLAGCAAAPRAPEAPAGLEMAGADEQGAATLLAAYLVARGYTVRLAGTAVVEAESADGDAFSLQVLLDPEGLDRLVLSRVYPAKEGADPGAVSAFAAELNSMLNVGVFSAYPPGIRFDSPLPFLDTLDPNLLEAFIAFTARVALAVRRVEAGRDLLVEVEGAGGSG